MTTGNLPQTGRFVGTNASANTTVTIQNQTIQFSATTVTLPAQTYTGSQTLLDPDTLQLKTFNYTFTTSAVNFVRPATTAATLTSSGGGLSWNTNETLLPSPTS